MTAIALVSVINHYYINELYLFWDILYLLIQLLHWQLDFIVYNKTKL